MIQNINLKTAVDHLLDADSILQDRLTDQMGERVTNTWDLLELSAVLDGYAAKLAFWSTAASSLAAGATAKQAWKKAHRKHSRVRKALGYSS